MDLEHKYLSINTNISAICDLMNAWRYMNEMVLKSTVVQGGAEKPEKQ